MRQGNTRAGQNQTQGGTAEAMTRPVMFLTLDDSRTRPPVLKRPPHLWDSTDGLLEKLKSPLPQYFDQTLIMNVVLQKHERHSSLIHSRPDKVVDMNTGLCKATLST